MTLLCHVVANCMKVNNENDNQEIILQDYFDGLLNDVDIPVKKTAISQKKQHGIAFSDSSIDDGSDKLFLTEHKNNSSQEMLMNQQTKIQVPLLEMCVEDRSSVDLTLPTIQMVDTTALALLSNKEDIKRATEIPSESPTTVTTLSDVLVVENKDKEMHAWANKPFECLIFSVSDLKLAVPLVSLGGIFKVGTPPAIIAGQAPWSLGLHQTEQGQLQLLDTAQLIMPEKHRNLTDEGFTFAIKLGESQWALGCNEIKQALTVDPLQVNWRSANGSRPWLAGIVKHQMCALIDVDGFIELLSKNMG